jgi:sugar fermentation stimulation protein A
MLEDCGTSFQRKLTKLYRGSESNARNDLTVKIAEGLKEADFLIRENRFACLVKLQGNEERVYLPNSGRLDTVLYPGQKVFLAERGSPSRRTKYDLLMASSNETMVSVDSRIPGELVYQALYQRALSPFSDYSSTRREVSFGRSRLDFLLGKPSAQCFLEVKSVTLVKGKGAAFPDAPTLRGRRHLDSLIHAKKEGFEAAVLFVIQREDADCFFPNDEIDPDFGQALRAAKLQGVSVYAYRCKVNPGEIELAGQLPVYL